MTFKEIFNKNLLETHTDVNIDVMFDVFVDIKTWSSCIGGHLDIT